MDRYDLKSVKEIPIVNWFLRESTEKENQKINSYNNDTRISNLERGIEFLQSLTTDEMNKYLKLKL